MKLALAQTQPVTGSVAVNVLEHLRFAERAVKTGANAIIFSELSLTGYEPCLVKQLALEMDDERLLPLQAFCNTRSVTLAAGAPIKSETGTQIALLIFQPNQYVKVYAKQYLHPDEELWFVPGKNFGPVCIEGVNICFAICYELTVQQHFENIKLCNPDVYVASVAKFERGLEPAHIRLAEIAGNGLPALMVNAVGPADGGVCVGQSAAWNETGTRLLQLPADEAGILMYDTVSKKAWRTET